MKYIFRCDKLVRDRIPNLIQQDGAHANTKILGPTEHLKALKNKLIEEAQEVAQADCPENLLEELADIYEVLEILVKKLGIKQESIKSTQSIKKAQKGAFSKGFFLETVEAPVESKTAFYFLESQPKYPKVEFEES